MNVEMEVLPRFDSYIEDWDYYTYVASGGYGSGKSHATAEKIVLKLLSEVRKCLVAREVFETIRESCFDLFYQIMNEMGILDPRGKIGKTNKVIPRTSPLQFIFPNGSRIIFKGLDKPIKLKSLNDVSIVWLEEASEIKYAAYKELIGRIRHPKKSIHFILTFNPPEKTNWTYTHFFERQNDDGSITTILDDELLYKKKTVVVGSTYYHHSLPDDNYYLPPMYIKQLDQMKEYDPDLYRVARLGRFGVSGSRVLPQFTIDTHENVMRVVDRIPKNLHFCGMDFGFVTSYNAVIKCAVDPATNWLYIYWEYYKNQMTDDQTADELIDLGFLGEKIIADCAEPKTIQYYRNRGIRMVKCHKTTKNNVGSRTQNVKKIKRFPKIVCSANCKNAIRELSSLTFKKDERSGEIKYDEFNIDPHTFSAIWYALDRFVVPDLKERNSLKGAS